MNRRGGRLSCARGAAVSGAVSSDSDHLPTSRRGARFSGGAATVVGIAVLGLGIHIGIGVGAEPPVAGPDAPGRTDGEQIQIRLAPGLEIAPFAREPDVLDPVALTFDEFGSAYVVEMRDYPYGLGPERKAGGTIRLLRDADGDGRTDAVTLFAEGLSFPTSVAPWNGGVLVTAPPEVLFLKDTDGDGRADVRETMLAGFRLGVTDSNANGLRWGLDNRIHLGNGGNGGDLRSPRQPGRVPVRLGNRDLRLDPATGSFEPTTDTGGGFGLVFDDWGRSFVPYNIDHMQQRVANTDRFAGLAGYPPFPTTHSISDHGDMARIFPISEARTRPNHPEQAGYFSAAGGMGFLGHLGWPGDLPGSVFVGDVVGNLFHRDVLVPDGAIFRATRAAGERDREFLAARDPGFRPVGLELGPDGALYVVDMQRDVIEHPDYIPARMLAKLDLRAGADRGRILRLAPKGWPTRRELPGRADAAGRVAMLGSSNQWVRVTAQRLLVAGGEPGVADRLRAMARDAAAPEFVARALGRVHALWTLDGLGQLDEATLLAALEDPHPGVRENAAVVAGDRSPSRVATSAAVRRKVTERLADPDARVRFRAALTLAPGGHAEVPALAALLLRDREDVWMRRAALAAAGGRTGPLLAELLKEPALSRDPAGATVFRELAAVAGGSGGANAVLARAVDAGITTEATRVALLAGLAEGLERTGTKPGDLDASLSRALAALEAGASRPLLAALWRVGRHVATGDTPGRRGTLAEAAREALDGTRETGIRLDAVRLLELGEFREAAPTLFALLSGVHPAKVQEGAFAALRGFRGHDAEIGTGLVKAWPALAPGLRASVVNALVYVAGFREALLGALESGALQVGELNLDLEHRRQLLRRAAPAIRERAAKFMSDEEYSNRKAVVDEWLARLPARGDATRGRTVFERICAQCHRAAGLGFDVGPELTGMNHRSVEDLLSNILDPNMAMNPAFVAYTAELADGEAETGILVGDSTAGIVLAQAGGRRVELPRSRIRELKSGGKSLMPDGLEAGLSAAEMRDLIAYVQEPGPETKEGQ